MYILEGTYMHVVCTYMMYTADGLFSSLAFDDLSTTLRYLFVYERVPDMILREGNTL